MNHITRDIIQSDYVKYLSAPTSVWWDITNRCNFNCIHCYSSAGLNKTDPNELSYDDSCRLIEELASLGVFFIYFLGGEPFVRKDFVNIVTFAREQDIGVMINTNGWFINESITATLKNIGVKEIRVSLDGATSDTHDAFRRKAGSFSRAVDALKILKEYDIPLVNVSTTVTRFNIMELDRLIDLVADLGVNNIQCLPLAKIGRGRDNYRNLELGLREYNLLKDIVNEKRTVLAGKLSVSSVEGVIDSAQTCSVKSGTVRPDFMGCRAGRSTCNIDYNGDIIPCLMVRKPVAGNVRLQSFKDIWNNSATFQRWRHKGNQFSECRSCDWNDVCIRECPLSQSFNEMNCSDRKQTIQQLRHAWNDAQNVCMSNRCPNGP